MSRPTSYAPGTFAWVDLRTTDPAGAKRFYADLFGWEYTDQGDPPGGRPYGVAALEGDPVSGLRPLAEAQRARGVSPFWYTYVNVESAEAATERTRELGGAVHAEPFDTGGGPLAAIIADPTGARLVLWESRDGVGACRVDEPGCMTWNELNTNAAAPAIEFYSALFGWRIEPIDTGQGPPYWTIGHDAAAHGNDGGVRELAPEQERASHWMPYFTVVSVHDARTRAVAAGGAALAGPLDLPAGRTAIVRDPQGAALGVFERETTV